MPGEYAWEKLYSAVLTLASNDGSLRSRLKDAHLYALTRLFNPPHHFPWPNIQRQFEALMRRIEGGALERLPEDDLRGIAEEIVSIYTRVARHQEPLD